MNIFVHMFLSPLLIFFLDSQDLELGVNMELIRIS